MRHIIALLFAVLPIGALAQDHYRNLTPLLEIFAQGADIPGFDVVGIRCAGVYYAQESYSQQNGGRGATAAQLRAGETGLELAVQHRIGVGQSLTDATLSVEADVLAVIDLYLARFAQNDVAGQPWQDDRMVQGDIGYCGIALD